MRNLYLTALLFCFCIVANAQLINICNSLSCADLRSPIDVVNTVVPRLSYAKPPLTVQKKNDVLYNVEHCDGNGDDLTFDSLDVPGTTTCTDEKPSLVFDVYYPTNNNYTVCKLPALILFHGGSYLECSDLTNPGVVQLCQDFTQRGFVVFSVEYRRGILAEDPKKRTVQGGIPSGITYTTAQQILAIYRACQDARGAIRSIVKYENTGWGHDDQNVDYPWHIDVNKIFVGGISAGCLIALNSVYDQDQTTQWDQIFQGGVSSSSHLGPIDNNTDYYAGSETPFPKDNIKGILDCWGALIVPATAQYNTDPYLFFQSNSNNPPVIGFHGKKDATFDYIHQGLYYSSAGYTDFDSHSETDCSMASTYTAPSTSLIGNKVPPNDIMLGSQSIYEMLKGASIFSEFYLDCQMEHGLDDCDCNTTTKNKDATGMCTVTCPYHSDFGVPTNTSQAATYNYIAQRGASFFQAILNGLSTNTTFLAGDSKFVECENYRYGCTPSDNDAGCSNEDSCN